MSTIVTLVRFKLDSGDILSSYEGVSGPTEFFEPDLLEVGKIEREIDPINGQFRFADCKITCMNLNRRWSDLLAGGDRLRGRDVEIDFGDDSLAQSSFTRIFTGTIVDWVMDFKAGTIRFEVKDKFWHELKKQFSGRFTDEIFPDLPDGTEPDLVPMLFGTLARNFAGDPIIRCKRIDPGITSAKYDYLVARHQCDGVTNVEADGVAKVLTTDYMLASKAFADIGTCQVIEFNSDPGASAVIKCDVTGFDASTFREFPAEIIQFLLISFAGLASGDIDTTAVTTAKNRQTSNLDHGSAGYLNKAAISIDEASLTVEAWINRIAKSHNLSVFLNRSGKVSMVQFLVDDVLSPTLAVERLDEGELANARTGERRSSELASSIAGNANRDFSEKSWIEGLEFNDSEAESELGGPFREEVEMWSAPHDDPNSTKTILRQKLWQMQEGIIPFEFDLPPSRYTLDLNDWISVSHWLGPDTGGWSEKVARIVGLAIETEPSKARVRCKTIIYPDQMRPSYNAQCRGWHGARFLSLTDLDSIAEWQDQIGVDAGVAGNPWKQATSLDQPLWRENIINGHPAVQFDGVNHYMATDANPFATGDEQGMVVVFYADDVTGIQKILNMSSGGQNQQLQLYLNGSTLRASFKFSPTAFMEATVSATTWYIVRAQYSAAASPNAELWVNGAQQDTNDETKSGTETALYLGGSDSGSEPFDGYIAEVALFGGGEGLLTLDQGRLVEKYLAAKYNISIS